MSDKTFGVKVSEELYEKVKAMIDVSGISSKEWFEKAVALTAVQDLKDGSGDYKQDLSELEVHTTRIYELVGNMIRRANYLKDDAVKELNEKLTSRDLTITELQNNVKAIKEQLVSTEEGFKQNESEKAELSEQLEQMRATNSNNQDLIKEYKEKVDTLSSLVNEYKGYAAENLELKQTHATEKEQLRADYTEKESRLVSSVTELKEAARDQAALIEQLQAKLESNIQDHKGELERLTDFNEKELQRTKEEHRKEVEYMTVNLNNQLTQLTDRKDLEKDRAILEIERKYQDKLEKIHEQYNEKIAGLYERLETKEKPNDDI